MLVAPTYWSLVKNYNFHVQDTTDPKLYPSLELANVCMFYRFLGISVSIS